MLRRTTCWDKTKICSEDREEQYGTKEDGAKGLIHIAMRESAEANRSQFQTELQIHSKMKHSNIVQFHRAFSYEKCTYIVLELCPNGSLMDMVKTRKFITEPEVRFWTVQMAGAIKYMHAKGIIHRDLKMGNIFLDREMNVKIGDFGLAALLMSSKDMNACRRTTLCGTPNYIAPEILEKNKGGHDHAVDIWSLGIIMYASSDLYLDLLLTELASLCSLGSLRSNRQPKMRYIAEPEKESTIGQNWIPLRTSYPRRRRTWSLHYCRDRRNDQILTRSSNTPFSHVDGCHSLKK